MDKRRPSRSTSRVRIPRGALPQVMAVRKQLMKMAIDDIASMSLAEDYVNDSVFGETDESFEQYVYRHGWDVGSETEAYLDDARVLYRIEQSMRKAAPRVIERLFGQLNESTMDLLVERAPSFCKLYQLEVDRGD